MYGRVSKGTIMLTVTLVATTGSGIVRQRCHGSPTRCAKHDAAVRNKLFVAARRVARIVAKLAIACRRRDGLQMPSGTALPGPGPLRPSPVVACRLCRNKLKRKSAALDSSLWASLGGRERRTRVHIQILYRATFEQFIYRERERERERELLGTISITGWSRARPADRRCVALYLSLF